MTDVRGFRLHDPDESCARCVAIAAASMIADDGEAAAFITADAHEKADATFVTGVGTPLCASCMEEARRVIRMVNLGGQPVE